MYKFKLTDKQYKKVKEIYVAGSSAQEVKDFLKLDISIRQIQRRLSADGLIRTVRQAYHIAIAKGRMSWKNRIPLKITTRLSQ